MCGVCVCTSVKAVSCCRSTHTGSGGTQPSGKSNAVPSTLEAPTGHPVPGCTPQACQDIIAKPGTKWSLAAMAKQPVGVGLGSSVTLSLTFQSDIYFTAAATVPEVSSGGSSKGASAHSSPQTPPGRETPVFPSSLGEGEAPSLLSY